MTWNKKNQQIEMLAGLRQSSVRVAQRILPRADKFKPTKVLVDLKQINKSIAKHRGRPYDPKTMKEAIAQLDESTFGWFVITKIFNWHLHEVMVYPVEMVLQKLSENRDKTPKLDRGNPVFSDAHKERLYKQQQQDISKMDFMYRAINLKFDRTTLVKLYRHANKSLADVRKSIELLLHRHSSGVEEIANPFGFIVSSLKERWIDTFDLLYSPELPKFESVKNISKYVDEIVIGIPPCPE